LGTIARAKCTQCGFTSKELYLEDTGLYSYQTRDMEPAFCSHCKKLIVVDYFKKPANCPNCRKEVVFYNEPSLREIPLEGKDTEPKKQSKYENFKLFDTLFLCPKCGQLKMKFSAIGLWD
jgi:predicted RNA-binding Zn-ribbon protein involved in translation (DUF1610 family)